MTATGATGGARAEERVIEAVTRSLEMGEVGVQVAAYLDGDPIVDYSAGVADAESGTPVTSHTLFSVFSVTKAVVATALHIQAERGLVSYDAAIASYWPEFAAKGKDAVTVRDALAHRAGIPQMPPDVTPERMCDWDWMVAEIAAMEPRFPPGTTNAYHDLSWGWIVGEIVCRVDPAARSLGDFVRQEICEPLEIEGLYLGLPASEFSRVAPVLAAAPPVQDSYPLRAEAMPLAVFPGAPVHNRPDVWQACIPGAGLITTARSCARFFALLANGGELDGVRLLSEERLRWCTTPRDGAREPDIVLERPALVGVGGYWVGGEAPFAYPVVGTNPNVLHHPGRGGSIGWADLDARLAVAICHNWTQESERWSSDSAVNPFIGIADAVRALAQDIREQQGETNTPRARQGSAH